MIEDTKLVQTKIFEGEVHGIPMKFIDLVSSGTSACVFEELRRDDYGLESISLSENDLVIDVGANIGMFSIYVKKKFGCKIISFEPVTINMNHFKQNILLNGLSIEDFELHESAISDIEGDTIVIGTPEYNSGGSSIFHTYSSIMTECKTELLNKYLKNGCTYLKIDTEGAEYSIIPKILKDLKKVKYLGIEYHKFLQSQNPIDLHALIKKNFKGHIFCQDPNS